MTAFWACACKLSWTLFRPPGFNPYIGREERRVQTGLDFTWHSFEKARDPCWHSERRNEENRTTFELAQSTSRPLLVYFSGLKYILARKMRHNARQSDNNVGFEVIWKSPAAPAVHEHYKNCTVEPPVSDHLNVKPRWSLTRASVKLLTVLERTVNQEISSNFL